MVSETKSDRDVRIKRNLGLAEAKIFVEMVKAARGNSRVLAGVAVAHDELGLPISWMRERMAGRIRIKPLDLETLKKVIDAAKATPQSRSLKVEGSRSRTLDGSNVELAEHRRVIAKFCRECAPSPDEPGDEQFCPDGVCPLRPISPLTLAKNAKRDLPIVGRDWGR
jgi:hypothetical protein|tara:strand:+ start:380 stop:880 length:501 start_codon:yes stop_codon:yes gene_type:complete